MISPRRPSLPVRTIRLDLVSRAPTSQPFSQPSPSRRTVGCLRSSMKAATLVPYGGTRSQGRRISGQAEPASRPTPRRVAQLQGNSAVPSPPATGSYPGACAWIASRASRARSGATISPATITTCPGDAGIRQGRRARHLRIGLRAACTLDLEFEVRCMRFNGVWWLRGRCSVHTVLTKDCIQW